MTAFFIALVVILGLCVLRMILLYYDEKEEEKEKEKTFADSIEKSFGYVKKYCGKFPASNDHIKSILSVFEELVTNGNLKYLQPFEAYIIPTTQFHFHEKFYILVDSNLQYKLVVTDGMMQIRDESNPDMDVEESARVVKKYLPYAKTLDEFKAFVNECQEEYNRITNERKRRDHVGKIIRKEMNKKVN